MTGFILMAPLSISSQTTSQKIQTAATFTVAGVACIGLNGSPAFKHNEAFSFQIATDDQEETDRYWNAIVARLARRSRMLRAALSHRRPSSSGP